MLATVQTLFLAVLAASPTQLKFAAPGFTGGNVPADVVAVASEHFSQQLTLQGFRVVTAKEIEAVLGVERQRQLLGCTDQGSSCLAELSSALGVDGIITGSLGRFGSRYTVNVKVVRSSDAKQLAVFSTTVDAEGLLPDALSRAAREVAAEVNQEMGRGPAEKTGPPSTGGAWSQRKRAGAIIAGIGAVVGVISIILGASAAADYSELARAADPSKGLVLLVPQAFNRRDIGQAKLFAGALTGAVAIGGLILGGSFFFSDDPRGALRVWVGVGPGGFALALGGPLP